jgi:hypothetical protein
MVPQGCGALRRSSHHPGSGGNAAPLRRWLAVRPVNAVTVQSPVTRVPLGAP